MPLASPTQTALDDRFTAHSAPTAASTHALRTTLPQLSAIPSPTACGHVQINWALNDEDQAVTTVRTEWPAILNGAPGGLPPAGPGTFTWVDDISLADPEVRLGYDRVTVAYVTAMHPDAVTLRHAVRTAMRQGGHPTPGRNDGR